MIICGIALSSYWTVAEPAMAPELHGMETPHLSHACEYETSMMLFLHGEIMRMDRVTSSPPLVDSPVLPQRARRTHQCRQAISHMGTYRGNGETSTCHAGKGGIFA